MCIAIEIPYKKAKKKKKTLCIFNTVQSNYMHTILSKPVNIVSKARFDMSYVKNRITVAREFFTVIIFSQTSQTVVLYAWL